MAEMSFMIVKLISGNQPTSTNTVSTTKPVCLKRVLRS